MRYINFYPINLSNLKIDYFSDKSSNKYNIKKELFVWSMSYVKRSTIYLYVVFKWSQKFVDRLFEK